MHICPNCKRPIPLVALLLCKKSYTCKKCATRLNKYNRMPVTAALVFVIPEYLFIKYIHNIIALIGLTTVIMLVVIVMCVDFKE